LNAVAGWSRIAPAIGMALYSARAILHGRGGRLGSGEEGAVSTSEGAMRRCGILIGLPLNMSVVEHRCHGLTAIAQFAGAIGCANSQIFYGCRKRAYRSPADRHLVHAGALAELS
jgi:hypothetical protein